jgi:hypothetical protein
MRWLVATERLGWPRHRWWQIWPWEVQTRRQYEIEPERPTATCHLQTSDREPALCGYEWEGLIAIPTQPDWYDLHPDMRCDECSASAGLPTEATAGPYKFDYER